MSEQDLSRYSDREKRRAYLKEYRENPENKARKLRRHHERYKSDPEYRERIRVSAKRTQDKRRNALLPLIKNAQKDGCIMCGEKDQRCLQFHHRDPSQKKFLIARYLTEIRVGRDPDLSKSKKVLLDEIAKCDVVCANCHFKIHDGECGGGRKKLHL